MAKLLFSGRVKEEEKRLLRSFYYLLLKFINHNIICFVIRQWMNKSKILKDILTIYQEISSKARF